MPREVDDARYERHLIIARMVLTRAGKEPAGGEIAEFARSIGRLISTFPPRTPDQVDKVAALLRPAMPARRQSTGVGDRT